LRDRFRTALSRWFPGSRPQAGSTRTLSRDAQFGWAEAALKQYGIGDARITLLKEGRGERKLVFSVESPSRGHFALQVFSLSRNNENLVPELLWLRALRTEEIPVPEPVPAADGSFVSRVSLEGASEPRLCALRRWLPGRPGGLNRGPRRSPAELSRAGSCVARMHRHFERYGAPEGVTFPYVWDWDWVFGKAVPLWNKGKSVYSPSELDVFRAAAKRVWQDLQELGKDGNVYGIIHRDLHPNNYLFHNGEAYVIDFEVCGWGYYLFDIAVTFLALERHGPQLQAAFLEGYRRERPLLEDHWRYFDTFIAMRLVQRVNMALRWKEPTRRWWGPKVLAGSAGALAEFLESEGRTEPMTLGSPWWRNLFRAHRRQEG
jgi:Ser/Thr protein kinase RdoA (MazF antagonist)